jgi:hypothetical protein
MEYDNLLTLINNLQCRIEALEEENVQMTNELYRLENSLEARIDILASEAYSLHKFSLDK